MTDKCRRKMNGRKEYITTEITQRKGGGMAKKKKEAQRKEGGSCMTEGGWGFPSSSKGSLFPWDVRPPDSVCFSPPKQAVALSEPNFWTHSLQIHCNWLGPKTVTLHKLF